MTQLCVVAPELLGQTDCRLMSQETPVVVVRQLERIVSFQNFLRKCGFVEKTEG